MKCLCGCGEDVPARTGKGRPAKYVSDNHRVTHFRYMQNDENDATKMGGPRPVVKYPGSKWMLAQWIVSQFPSHTTYVEPYFGSGAVFFTKAPAEYEVINDLDEQVVNLFRVIRQRGRQLAELVEMTPYARTEYYESYQQTGRPLEDARRFLVRCWMAHGVKTSDKTGWMNRGPKVGGTTTAKWNKLPERLLAVVERLKNTEIECIPALDLISRFKEAENCLLYVDPPYVLSTRSKRMYKHEMTNADHLALLDALDAHAGPVVLSGYAHPLYDDRLSHWQRLTCGAIAEKGQMRTECLWLNAKVQRRQLSLFEVEGA
jgi:DNA adenine methylase